MRRNLTRTLALWLGLSLVSCSGGATVVPAVPNGSASIPTTARVVLPLGAASTASLPAIGGISGTVTLPAVVNAAPNAALTVDASIIAPPGAPSLQSTARNPQSGLLTFFVFYTFSVNATTTFAQLPGFTVTLPPSISTTGQQFFYAFSNPAATNVALQFITEGPAAVDGQQITFAPSADSITLKAGTRYIFAFYGIIAGIAQQRALYVLNQETPSITVYDPTVTGNASPIRTISGNATQLNGGFGIAVDGNGSVYAGNSSGVLVFAPGASGNAAPVRVISGPAAFGSDTTRGLAVDSSGNLYVAIGQQKVAVFAPGANGNVAPTRLIAGPNTDLGFVTAVAVDTQGSLFATGDQVGPAILQFPPGANGNATVSRDISGSSTELTRAILGLAVDGSGHIYAAEPFEVLEFGPQQNGNVAPIASFFGGADVVGISGLAIDPNNHIYATTVGYAPGQFGVVPPTISTVSGGNVTPLITGNLTGLNVPIALAIGPQ